MLIKYPIFFVFLILLPLNTLADNNSDKTLRDWLDAITASALKYSYEGTFVYHCRSQIMAMRIVHSADGTNEQEQITSLSGPEHQIFQQGRSLTSSFKGTPLVSQNSRSTDVLTGQRPDFDKILMANYRINSQGMDRIADRQTQVVHVAPNDQYRYGYNLWLDTQTDLVLRSDMIDHEGHVIEQVMFVEISLMDYDKAQAQMNVPKADAIQSEANNSSFHVEWLIGLRPEGFILTDHYVKPASKRQLRYEHMVLTDGLASVSVFIEKVTSDSESLVGQRKMGAVNAFSRVINDYLITVVGDVPAVTVKLIAQAVRPES